MDRSLLRNRRISTSVSRYQDAFMFFMGRENSITASRVAWYLLSAAIHRYEVLDTDKRRVALHADLPSAIAKLWKADVEKSIELQNTDEVPWSQ